MPEPHPESDRLPMFSTWWPLACSWVLMGLEMPMFLAAVSRLSGSEPNLTRENFAAFNTVVYPVSMTIEGPIVMLLAASTALVVDRVRYRQLRRFTIGAALVLTLVHALVAFTPLYDQIARDWIGLDAASLEPGRIGLRIMLPWTAMIAYRRFLQGILIRHGHSGAVGTGTLIRLIANGSVLAAGLAYGTVDGIVLGASAIVVGVTAEAVYAILRARPVLDQLALVDPTVERLSARAFTTFYLPLALIPSITLAMQPITAAAIWRLPEAERSSAAWGAVYSLIFLFRALGFAFQEVVVTFEHHPNGGSAALRRFALRLAGISAVTCAVVAWTPLGRLIWFEAILELPPELSAIAAMALPFGVVLPTLAVLQNWLQGRLVAEKRTRGSTEAALVYVLCACAGFWIAT